MGLVATPREDLRQRVQLEQQLIARLRTATLGFSDAQTERIWAIVSAHQAGLSIRKIADASGLKFQSHPPTAQRARSPGDPRLALANCDPRRQGPLERKPPKGPSRKPRSEPAWQEKWRCCAAALVGCSGWSAAKPSS